MKTLFELAGVISVYGLELATKQMTDFEKQVKKSIAPLNNFARQAQYAGTQLTRNLTIPLGAAGAASIKFAADFEKSMTTSTAIMGEVSAEMNDALAETAKRLSTEVTFSANELAKSYYYLASAGLTAEQSMTALSTVANFAAAGQFDLQVASDLLTDAQMALGLASKDAAENQENMARVSDVLVLAATKANATVEQFAISLTNKAGTALRLLGKDIEEGVAVLASFANQGVKAEEAGTQLAIVLRDLQKAALMSGDEFEQLGVRVYNADGDMRNMADIIKDLEDALSGMSDEQIKATLSMLNFQDKSVHALTTLIGTSDMIRQYESDLRTAAGTTDAIAKKQLKNFSDQLTLLWNKLKLVSIELGAKLIPIIQKTLIPIVTGAISVISELTYLFTSQHEVIQALTAGFIGFLAILGPFLIVIGKLITIVKILPALLTTVRLAVIALNSVLLVAPWAAIAIAIAAVAGVVIKVRNANKKALEVQRLMNEELQTTGERVKELRAQWESQIEGVIKINKAYDKKIEKEKLLRKLMLQGFRGEELKKAYDEQVKFIEKSVDAVANSFSEMQKSKESFDKNQKELDDKASAEKQKKLEEAYQKEEAIRKINEHHEWQTAMAVEEIKKKYYDDLSDMLLQNEEDLTELAKKELDIEKELIEAKENLRKYDETTRENIEKKFTGLLKSGLDQKLYYMNLEKNANLKTAQEIGEDTTKINEYYTQLEKDLRNEDLSEKLSSINNYVQRIGGMFSQVYNNQSIAIDNNYKKEKKRIEETIGSQEAKAKAIEELDEKTAKKRSELAKKQAIADKAFSLFEIGINTASSIVKALGNPVLVAFIAAMGAAQAAIVASTPIPEMAEGGVIKAKNGGRLVMAGEAGQDEAFIPMQKGTASISDAIINKLGKYPTSQIEDVTPNVASGNTVHLNIGTLIADKSGLTELERKLKTIRISENTRIGIA